MSDNTVELSGAERPLRIAVVGAGPSGCFIAGALRRSLPTARIVVIDRLPCPFGLVRYGVASDHQSTKNITRQFDRIFSREGVEFAGNVSVTTAAVNAEIQSGAGSVTLAELRDRVDAVVFATGLAADRALGVPGEGLPGVIGSGALTRVLNSHPDDADAIALTATLGERVAIVGLGNVAVDIIRFLAKEAADFEGSDINDAALAAYHRAPVTRIDVFSRSAIELAKCDAQMIRELGQISGLVVSLHGDTATPLEQIEDRVQKSRVEALRELAQLAADAAGPRIELRLHFGAAPQEVLGEERVVGLRVALSAGGTQDYAVDSVVSAIGFGADAHSPDIGGTRADGGSCRVEPGLYRVGWLRRGPQGTIPENRADAVAVAAEIVADLESGAIPRADIAAEAPILPSRARALAVSYEDWLRVDRHECEHAATGRTRSKLPTTVQMLEVARQGATAA